MVTVGSGEKERHFQSAYRTKIVDLSTYNKKAAADERRWTTSYANFENQNPPPAYYHASPLMRLPTELRLRILAHILFDPDEINFTFPLPSSKGLFMEAVQQHAVQIPSSCLKRSLGYPLRALISLGHNSGPAPQWKDQTFVEITQKDPGDPRKRSNARKVYAQIEGECVHRRRICLLCHIHCYCRKHHRVSYNRTNGQVLRVCKGMYYDALPVLYKLNVFAFENAYEMGAVLHAMGPGRAFIRYVDVRSQLFHGGMLWDYMMPCKTIRQLYFPESFVYAMKRGGQRLPVDKDRGIEFFVGWMIRGGEAFFDMVRTRERGLNDPHEVLMWHGGCKDAAMNRKASEELRARLNGNKKAGPSTPTQSHFLPVFTNSLPTSSSSPIEHYVWKDSPLGPEQTAPSLLSRHCWRLYYPALRLSIFSDAVRHKYVQTKDELSRLKRLPTIQNAVGFTMIVITTGAEVVLLLIMGVPLFLVTGTLVSIVLAIGLFVKLVWDTVNFITFQIPRPWGMLINTPAPSTGRRHTGNWRPRG
ncbi:hypothetical protein P171DRAFT_434009 [Karstenula rhodostoma CBS 690.94]|uniref:Uncharacterized protein n=1 Tax=Karstenula rhodostoma CBS 690.94 TaxID=1392251 RepID=A0A9P4PCK3_9PLEO|nr:hypothetical protein P171DRAFT_434009 [Karstenula rhodostoma CBS 690.94]